MATPAEEMALRCLQAALAATLAVGAQLVCVLEADSPVFCVALAAPLSFLGGLALPARTLREALIGGVVLLAPVWILMPAAYWMLVGGDHRYVGLLIASLAAWVLSPTGALLRVRLTRCLNHPAQAPAT